MLEIVHIDDKRNKHEPNKFTQGTAQKNIFYHSQAGVYLAFNGGELWQEAKESNETLLGLDTDVDELLNELNNASQTGTRLLSLAGSIHGPKDMSIDKKKYL
jgi:hypothetical protein